MLRNSDCTEAPLLAALLQRTGIEDRRSQLRQSKTQGDTGRPQQLSDYAERAMGPRGRLTASESAHRTWGDAERHTLLLTGNLHRHPAYPWLRGPIGTAEHCSLPNFDG